MKTSLRDERGPGENEGRGRGLHAGVGAGEEPQVPSDLGARCPRSPRLSQAGSGKSTSRKKRVLTSLLCNVKGNRARGQRSPRP